jgi:hypothetical protein
VLWQKGLCEWSYKHQGCGSADPSFLSSLTLIKQEKVKHYDRWKEEHAQVVDEGIMADQHAAWKRKQEQAGGVTDPTAAERCPHHRGDGGKD